MITMFAVIVIPGFSLQAVLRILPIGRARRAVAVMTSEDSRSAVLQCNAVAAAAGIVPGLTAAQAMARCPDIEMHARSDCAETAAHEAALAAAWTLSPRVEETAPGICTIDLRGHSDAKKAGRLAAGALARLAALGLKGRVGIARTPRIARYAAGIPGLPLGGAACPQDGQQPIAGRKSALGPHPSPEAAKGAATRSTSEDSVRVIAPTEAAERAFLAPLPVALAEPTVDQAAVLAGWGVETLGELTALPRAEAAMRLGGEGGAFWDRAAGREDRVLRHAKPRHTFEAEFEFEEEIETLEPLLFLLRRYCDQLSLQLTAAGFAASEIQLSLTLAEGKHERGFQLPSPTGDPGVFFRVLHTHLETVKTDTPVVAVHLSMTPARPLHRQRGLFDSSLVDTHGLNETLARVGALMKGGGATQRVGVPVLENTRRPDAVRLEAVPDRVEWQSRLAGIAEPRGLPLRRYRPPLPARVETEDGRPVWVIADGTAGPVIAALGPWRGSGEWWSAESWERDEWDVEIAGAGLHRIYESGGKWFVEGEYD